MKHRYYVGNNRYWTKRDFRNHFDGSDALFEYCWRKARYAYCGDGDMQEWIEQFAAEAVNDEKSKFYMYG